MFRRFAVVLLVLTFGVLLASAPAQAEWATPPASSSPEPLPDTPVGRQLARVINVLNDPDSALPEGEIVEHLAPEFLAIVPPPQVAAVVQQLAAAYGPFSFSGFIRPPTDIDAMGTLVGRAGDAFTVTISVEPTPPHRIVALLIEPGTPSNATPVPLAAWDELEGRLRALAPQVNFLAAEITDGTCRPVHAIDAERRLAIGSTFKLYVLGELAHQVEQGTASWDEQLAIRGDWKSLPSGKMQDEPAGTVHPLRVYAEQMISISDNTATDHLLLRLGRENVEAFQTTMGHGDPARNVPFLTTRETFALKLKLSPERRDAYIVAPPAEKRRLLAEEASPAQLVPADVATWLAPRQIEEIEWYASADDLCAGMTTLQAMSERPGLESVQDILALNPGIPFDSSAWRYVGFKGGSEPGVLNLTWLLERADGRWFVLTAGLNDPDRPLNERAVIELLSTVPPLLVATP